MNWPPKAWPCARTVGHKWITSHLRSVGTVRALLVSGRLKTLPITGKRQRYMEDEHNVMLTVPKFEPVPPNYHLGSLASCRNSASHCFQTSYFARKVPSSYSTSRPTGPTSLRFAQQGIRSTLLLDDPDLQQDPNPGFPSSLYDGRKCFHWCAYW